MLKNNCNEEALNIQTFARRMKQTLVESGGETLDIVAVRAQGNMINPGGMGEPIDADKLTTRSGRLMKSIGPAGGVFNSSGNREAIREIDVKGNKVILTFGSEVPYLPPHEYGGAMPARDQIVTDRMRRFFWAKMYETGDEKFKAMALSQSIHIPGYNMPKRPVITPAANDSISDIENLMRRKLEGLASGYSGE